jgi:hypothetical protein
MEGYRLRRSGFRFLCLVVLATWDIRSKNGCFCFSFLRFLEDVAFTDERMQEHFVCLHP